MKFQLMSIVIHTVAALFRVSHVKHNPEYLMLLLDDEMEGYMSLPVTHTARALM